MMKIFNASGGIFIVYFFLPQKPHRKGEAQVWPTRLGRQQIYCHHQRWVDNVFGGSEFTENLFVWLTFSFTLRWPGFAIHCSFRRKERGETPSPL